jgi:hypothetical protein
MKVLAWAISVGGLLAVALAIAADCELSLAWTPGGVNNYWDNAGNWGGSVYPGQTNRNGHGSIGGSQSAWPQLQNSRCICALTMSDAASLDPNSKTLTVTEGLSINSTNESTPVQISSEVSGGGINTTSITISGGSNGTSVFVFGCTVRTGNYGSCP